MNERPRLTPRQGQEGSRDRRATEARLESAALELLNENGILAGLNLREVADRVDTNRGLVYHYFGSRRDLLRSALRRRGGALSPMLRQVTAHGFVSRAVETFAAVGASQDDYARLVTLLVLDGDPDVQTMPMAQRLFRQMEVDRERGELPPNADLKAVMALLSAASIGYAIFRRRFAAELGTSVDELNDRVLATLEQILRAWTSEPSGSKAAQP